jgi:hypothetical protein
LNLKRERLFTGIFLFLVCVQLAHFVHSGWFSYQQEISAPNYHAHPPEYADFYRVAIPALVRFIGRAFHIYNLPVILTALDFVTGFFALYLFYLLTVDLPPEEPNRPKDRALKILLFLAIIQFAITWVVPLQRPETMPSSLFLAFALCCLVRIRNRAVWILPILAATAIQAFARTDVPFVLGAAILLVGLWAFFKPASKSESSAARLYILTGALVAFLSGATQVFLSSLHPHHPLDFQLKRNLHPHYLEVFTIVMLPYALFFLFLIVQRPVLNTLEKVALLSALLYLPIYFTFGIAHEVRIYVPFMFVLDMVIARVWGSFLIHNLANAIPIDNA